MKNKNFIFFLLIVFSLICAYNIYYTVGRIRMDNELASMAPAERSDWLKDADNVDHYKYAVDNSFSLGLDLQGGMFITMEVGVDDVVAGLADNPQDSTFQKAMRLARQGRKNSQDGFVDLFVRALHQVDPKAKLATYFAGKGSGLSFTASDNEVARKLKLEADAAVDRTFNILRTRIDQFGVTSPNLQKQPGTGRILIELPGVKDAARVRKLLRGTARLEFWPTYTIQEAFPYLEKINQRVREVKGIAKDTTQKAETKKDSTKADKLLANKLTGKKAPAVDSSTVSTDTTKTKSLQEALKGNKSTGKDSTLAGNDTLNKDQQRAKFDKENPFFAVLRFPDFKNTNPNSPVVGYATLTDTTQVNRYLALPQVKALLPNDLKFLWTAKPENENSQYLELVAIKSNRGNQAALSGDVIVDTKQDFDQGGKKPVVSMSMNAEGAKVWKKMTTDYLGKSIAVVLDNLVYTFPVVNNVIANGNSTIQGNFTIEEAKDLANILKAGKLPAPATIEGEDVVGPTLGSDTTHKGLISFFLGFAGVIGFLILYYRGSGIVASIALLVNLFFVVGISAAFGIVMTLPGIAGIVLSMAMAVDANVLIYERIREELEQGRSFKSAISAGFRNALSAILDGNVTTFLTGIVLFIFGTGPIRGFAVTLMIGIGTTLVAALIVTRLILEYLASKSETSTIQFGNKAASKFFHSFYLNLIDKRKAYYVLTSVLVVLAVLAVLGFGFKFGVDFKGGRQYVVEFSQNPDVELVRRDLTQAFNGNAPIIKTVGNNHELMVTTSYLYDDPQAEDKVNSLLTSGLQPHFASLKPQVVRSTTIGPTVAQDIQTGAIKAVVISLIAIFIYIFIRFRRWQYGLGAVVALAFNVLMVVGLFALLGSFEWLPFSAEIDQTFIAAVLTIVGYTINDTVVVFDRIRETALPGTSKDALPGLYNRAINDTFSRTVVTAVTTILSALILFFFGGDVLKGFMLALVVGILVGTYSSIFIASPISLDTQLRGKEKAPEPERVRA